MTGQATGGKPINLSQLEAELTSDGLSLEAGLGLSHDTVYTYDELGQPADFVAAEQPMVDQAIAEHVGMRDKTDAEYAEEFQNPATTPERKQEIRDQQNGLLPREQVPM